MQSMRRLRSMLRAGDMGKLGRVVPVLALLAVTALPAGCGPADDVALVNELAARLDSAGELTYTAEYRLAGGSTATVAQAQQPKRAAYTFPGGKAVVTDSSTADCRAVAGAVMHCVLTAPPSPNTDPALDLLTGTEGGALISPAAVLRRLTEAIDEGATITRHEATIAGSPANCLGVHGSAGFTACLTADGLLGRFTGTVDGSPVDIELIRLASTVDKDQFELPAGAEVDDRRPGTK